MSCVFFALLSPSSLSLWFLLLLSWSPYHMTSLTFTTFICIGVVVGMCIVQDIKWDILPFWIWSLLLGTMASSSIHFQKMSWFPFSLWLNKNPLCTWPHFLYPLLRFIITEGLFHTCCEQKRICLLGRSRVRMTGIHCGFLFPLLTPRNIWESTPIMFQLERLIVLFWLLTRTSGSPLGNIVTNHNNLDILNSVSGSEPVKLLPANSFQYQP